MNYNILQCIVFCLQYYAGILNAAFGLCVHYGGDHSLPLPFYLLLILKTAETKKTTKVIKNM